MFESELELADKIVVFTLSEHLTKAGQLQDAEMIRRKINKTEEPFQEKFDDDSNFKVSFNEILAVAKRTGDYKKGLHHSP